MKKNIRVINRERRKIDKLHNNIPEIYCNIEKESKINFKKHNIKYKKTSKNKIHNKKEIILE